MLVRLAICCCVGSASAAETAKNADPLPTHRFYGGVAVASLAFDDHYGGVGFSDRSVGLSLFGGAYLKERLSLELSFDSFDAIDLRDLAGSGVIRFDVRTRRRTETLSVVRDVSLRDLFGWQRDWRLFGMAGLYRSDISRAIDLRNKGENVRNSDDITGLAVGGGVLYRIRGVDLRGYFRQFGATDEREGREVGVAVQRRF